MFTMLIDLFLAFWFIVRKFCFVIVFSMYLLLFLQFIGRCSDITSAVTKWSCSKCDTALLSMHLFLLLRSLFSPVAIYVYVQSSILHSIQYGSCLSC